MKKIILILITILTSTIITSQVRFNYVRWIEFDEKEDSTGVIYFSSDPDTIIDNHSKYEAAIFYDFDNEGEIIHYIPVYKLKLKGEKVIYYGKWKKDYFRMIFNKQFGDFQVIERALFPRNRTTMYFHRDYDYYDNLDKEILMNK